jgi:hypothetical protein
MQAAALAAVLVAIWSLVSPLAAQPVCCDASEYLKLAADPGTTVLRPYSMRVLVPWLVHLIGGDPIVTFHILTLVFLAATGLLVYLLARRAGAPHVPALVAVAGLECSRGLLFLHYDPWLTEPVAYLLIAAVFLVLVSESRHWVIAPLLVLLAAAREQFVAMSVPIYAWYARRAADPRAVGRTAALLVPAVLVFAALWILPEVLPPTPLSQPMGLAYTLRKRWDGDGWLIVSSAFAMSLGAWWPLAVASLGQGPLRRLRWWLLPVLAYLFVIGWDWARYATYAFPVVMTAGALTIARAGRMRPLLLGLVALQALAPLADFLAAKPSLDDPGPSLLLSTVLIVATTVVLVAGRSARDRDEDRARA